MRKAMSAALLALACQGAGAGALTVRVADQSAAPVVDAVVYATATSPAASAKAPAAGEIGQENLTFIPRVTVLQTGASVTFPNRDTVRHHVYSFSLAKIFELRLYAGRPATPIVFDKPGLVVLGCNIHDRMVAYVMVVDTPWFGKTGADGQVRIDGLPAGEYHVSIWASRMTAQGAPRTVVVGADTGIDATVDLRAAP